eukprot:s2623_g4.t1
MHVCSEGLAKAAMPEMEFPRRRRRWSSSRAGLLGRPARATGVAGAAAVLWKPRTASRSTGDQKFQRFAGTCGCFYRGGSWPQAEVALPASLRPRRHRPRCQGTPQWVFCAVLPEMAG